MIDRLRGIILEKRLDGVVVESGSFGLRVFLPGPNLGRIDEGDEVVLYTYLQVKDDGFSLFGFLDEEDRELFLGHFQSIFCRRCHILYSKWRRKFLDGGAGHRQEDGAALALGTEGQGEGPASLDTNGRRSSIE